MGEVTQGENDGYAVLVEEWQVLACFESANPYVGKDLLSEAGDENATGLAVGSRLKRFVEVRLVVQGVTFHTLHAWARDRHCLCRPHQENMEN